MYMYVNGKHLVAFMKLKIEMCDEPKIGDYITLYWKEEHDHDPDDIFYHDDIHKVIFEIVSYDMNGFVISPIDQLSRDDFEKMCTKHTRVVYNDDMAEKIIFEDIKPFEDDDEFNMEVSK